MEKEPKIGKSLEGDVAIPEFKTKEPKIELGEGTYLKKSESRSEVRLPPKLEDIRIPEEIDPSKISNEKLFRRMLIDPHGLSSAVITILRNKFNKQKISPQDQSLVDKAKEQWFKTRFGVTFAGRKYLAKDISKKKEGGSTGSWLEVAFDAKSEFPPNIQRSMATLMRKERIPKKDFLDLRVAVFNWWKERFGIEPWKLGGAAKKDKKPKVKPETKKERKEKVSQKLQDNKAARMEELHNAIRNLDDGEPVDEFRDEARKVLYFDEENGQYYIEENGEKKYLGIGDITSDYAWGIKYVPDGEMTEPEYRTVAKRILINETRRDLEVINDVELFGIDTVENHSPINIARRLAKNVEIKIKKSPLICFI